MKFIVAASVGLCFLLAVSSALPASLDPETREQAARRKYGVGQFSDCEGSVNTKEVLDADKASEVVLTVKNGIAVKTGGENNTVYLFHLYGTPKERGLAHGQLAKGLNLLVYDQFEQWLASTVQELLKPYLPEVLRNFIVKYGPQKALAFVHLLTKQYTPSHFMEELEGLAEGLGVEKSRVINFHMFPELIRAACSMFGAWGEATKETNNGGLIQLRALDWGTDSPLRFYPVVLVYHTPNEAESASFVSLSWAGFLGTLTGMSEKMGISEKKWYHSAPTEYLPIGYPWNFLLRDILEFDRTLAAAESRIQNARKTASIFVGIGSRDEQSFVAEEYGVNTARIFNDSTPFPGYAPTVEQHPMMTNLVYIDKHTQPSGQWCMAKVLEKNYGAISPQAAIELVSLLQTGDIHLAFYDFTANHFYFSVASTNAQGTVLNAYDNQFIRLDLNTLYAVPAPQV